MKTRLLLPFLGLLLSLVSYGQSGTLDLGKRYFYGLPGYTDASASSPIESGNFQTMNWRGGTYAVKPAVTGMPFSSNWIVIIGHHEDTGGPGGGGYWVCWAINLFDATVVYTGGRNGGDGSWLGWNQVSTNVNYGIATFSGDGSKTTFSFPHGVGPNAPSFFSIDAASSDAKNISYTDRDGTNLYVRYATPPPSGTNNVIISWSAKK